MSDLLSFNENSVNHEIDSSFDFYEKPLQNRVLSLLFAFIFKNILIHNFYKSIFFSACGWTSSHSTLTQTKNRFDLIQL